MYILIAALWVQDGKEYLHKPKNITTGFVVTGYRHSDCLYITSMIPNTKTLKKVQGFLTNDNTFLDRVEAMRVFKETFPDKKVSNSNMLFSEDLY